VRWSIILAVIILIAALFLPVPFVSRAPGPVFDVLGEVDGEPVMKIEGAESHPVSGVLDMTTVSESGGSSGTINLVAGIYGLFAPNQSVIPTDEVYTDGPPTEEDRELNEQVFAASQSDALAAAANYLERPVTSQVLVTGVSADGPAAGTLEAGDLILSVNGHPVATNVEVGELISPLPVGSEVTLVIKRDGEEREVRLQTAPNPEEPERSMIGIFLDTHYESDFTVDIALSDIGGPSAGLVFALGMVDKLTKEDLLADNHIAGTGTISSSGEVGPIGGIDKKMVAAAKDGATLFLAPADNCEDVVGNIPDGLTVASVATLSEAIEAIDDYTNGRPVTSCPVDAETQATG